LAEIWHEYRSVVSFPHPSQFNTVDGGIDLTRGYPNYPVAGVGAIISGYNTSQRWAHVLAWIDYVRDQSWHTQRLNRRIGGKSRRDRMSQQLRSTVALQHAQHHRTITDRDDTHDRHDHHNEGDGESMYIMATDAVKPSVRFSLLPNDSEVPVIPIRQLDVSIRSSLQLLPSPPTWRGYLTTREWSYAIPAIIGYEYDKILRSGDIRTVKHDSSAGTLQERMEHANNMAKQQLMKSTHVWDQLSAARSEMNDTKIPPSTVVMGRLLEAFLDLRAWTKFDEIVTQLSNEHIPCDYRIYFAQLRAASLRNDMTTLGHIWQAVEKSDIPLSHQFYHTALEALSRDHQADSSSSLSLLDRIYGHMRQRTGQPSQRASYLLLKAYGRHRQIDKMVQVVGSSSTSTKVTWDIAVEAAHAIGYTQLIRDLVKVKSYLNCDSKITVMMENRTWDHVVIESLLNHIPSPFILSLTLVIMMGSFLSSSFIMQHMHVSN
jgi:hypothetical protein